MNTKTIGTHIAKAVLQCSKTLWTAGLPVRDAPGQPGF
jgi:hypothetical protein